MKKIKLSQGKFALVDDDDFEHLSQWRWYFQPSRNGNGYAVRRTYIKNNKFEYASMHASLFNDKRMRDHEDGNGLNNQRSNLRVATRSQNNMNRKKQKNPTASKYKGVKKSASGKKWISYIYKNKKSIYLATHKTQKQAAISYNLAAKKYHGKFARLNRVR